MYCFCPSHISDNVTTPVNTYTYDMVENTEMKTDAREEILTDCAESVSSSGLQSADTFFSCRQHSEMS